MDDEKHRDAQPPCVEFPTEEEISARAYEMFFLERDRRASGDCWRVAETELLEEAARKIPRPHHRND